METKLDITTAYRKAIAQADSVIAAIGEDQRGLATPCPKWDVLALLNHFIGSNLMMARVGSGESAGRGMTGTDAVAAMGDLAGGDALAAYRSASARALEAFTRQGNLERVWALPFGEVPGALALNIHFVETVAHAWDLARATGQLERLDAELAEQADAVARGIVAPEFRNDAGDPFGPEVACADEAPAYSRFAAFLGRTP